MIACVAYMAGYDLDCNQTQTFVYAYLAGVAINSVVKKAGIKIGVKVSTNIIKNPRNRINKNQPKSRISITYKIWNYRGC